MIVKLNYYKYPPSPLDKYKCPFFHRIETDPKENYQNFCHKDWSKNKDSLLKIENAIGKHHAFELKTDNLNISYQYDPENIEKV